MTKNSQRLSQHTSQQEDASEAVEEDGLTLEELSQSYQQLLAQRGDAATYRQSVPAPDEPSGAATGTAPAAEAADAQAGTDDASNELDPCPVTPASIIEAVLFVGRPDGGAITAAEMAALMRGVHESEVVAQIAQLNSIYAQTGRATRIVAVANGYRLQLAEDLQMVRDNFYGRVRQVKLNQAAVDCLALIAYQPGISREKLEEQRGQPSGSVLNQLVRRQLIEMRREAAGKAAGSDARRQCYYPTERLFELAGIESLDDLPRTEEF